MTCEQCYVCEQTVLQCSRTSIQPPPPQIWRPNLADFAELVCRIVGFLNLADLFCRITRFLGLCRLFRLAMKCFCCPQKDVSLVPWDSLSSADQAFLRDKYPDAGEGAVCEFCVRSARPSAFFSRRSSGSSSSGPQSVNSGLLAPAVDSVSCCCSFFCHFSG